LDFAPSAAISSRVFTVEPSDSVSSGAPGISSVKPETATPCEMVTPAASHFSRSAPFMATFGTMWAKGSPGATSPSKVRKTGRTGSPVRLSVTIISRIGSASGRIFDQQPSSSSMRMAAAAIAEARPSFFQTPSGAGSTMRMARCGAACAMAAAVARPT
jgi:hypothetical protein